MGYARKTDNNQGEMVETLERLGFSVYQAHAVGNGFTDLVLGKWGHTFLAEVKDPKKGRYTKAQHKFIGNHKGIVFELKSVEDCVAFSNFAHAHYNSVYCKAQSPIKFS